MGPELLLVSAGLQLFQGFQGYQQGKAQAKAALQTADYNVAVDQQTTAVEKQQLKRQQMLFSGTQKARAAVSGATLESFGDVFEDTSSQSLLDVALLDFDAKLRQDQMRYQGNVDAYAAKNKGRDALISGIGNAAGSGIGYYQGSQGTFGGGTTRLRSGETINWRRR